VDVPSLDAVAFLDPRDSVVDIVQAVGRVMRKAKDKNFGYIIVPILLEGGGSDDDVVEALEANTEGYDALGKVLRALQSHDERLPENPARFMEIYDVMGGPSKNTSPDISGIADTMKLDEFATKIYAKVVSASGLGSQGRLTSEEIKYVVERAGRLFEGAGYAERLTKSLGMEGSAPKSVCVIAALLITNACLLHRRLSNHVGGEKLATLNEVSGSDDPKTMLAEAWHVIMRKDYAPIFKPALLVLRSLDDEDKVTDAINIMVDCANRVADTLSEMGYDHSGHLYHSVLPTATSDGALYTKSASAFILAQLAGPREWNNLEKIKKLRIMDPACGTGALLMAVLHTIKSNMSGGNDDGANNDNNGTNDSEDEAYIAHHIHKILVEDVLCGLDINSYGVQFAAGNLTLGAPDVDYDRMNMFTIPYGPQPGGGVLAGSLELLRSGPGEGMRARGQHNAGLCPSTAHGRRL